jgi:copper chaperone
MKSVELNITGMSCNHCVKSVQNELAKLPLEKLDVTIGNVKVDFDENKISIEQIKNSVIEAGYEILV